MFVSTATVMPSANRETEKSLGEDWETVDVVMVISEQRNRRRPRNSMWKVEKEAERMFRGVEKEVNISCLPGSERSYIFA